ATTFLYDSFNYSTGSLGTVGSPTWVKNGTTADPTVQNVGGLTYPGLQVSGNTLSLQYDGSGVVPGPAGTDGTTISSGITSGNLYYSFLMKVTAVQTLGGNGFATGGNLTNGSFMAGLETLAATNAPTAGASAAPLLIRSGDPTNQFATTYQLGTAKTATTADRQWYTAQSFTTGPNAETVFVVLKYSIDPVNGDSASLFINPTPGSSEPAAQLAVAAGTALVGATNGIRSFFVRNNSVEPDTMLIDELRVADTWSEVTPAAVSEPATLALFGLGLAGFIFRRWRS
ncbi:MAG: PEP-CTERM sorting domain-containing protein, partial [Limisphaerales bacterium]